MTYEQIVADVAYRTGISKARVRAVLAQFPLSLALLPVGDKVTTPLGSFVKFPVKPRKIYMPDGVTLVDVPEQAVVKLRPGTALRQAGLADPPLPMKGRGSRKRSKNVDP
jgi:nucleoid DNA-binding protein